MSPILSLLGGLAILSLGACVAGGPVQNTAGTKSTQKDPCAMLTESRENLRKTSNQYFSQSAELQKCLSDSDDKILDALAFDVFGYNACQSKKEAADRTKKLFNLELINLQVTEASCSQNNANNH